MTPNEPEVAAAAWDASSLPAGLTEAEKQTALLGIVERLIVLTKSRGTHRLALNLTEAEAVIALARKSLARSPVETAEARAAIAGMTVGPWDSRWHSVSFRFLTGPTNNHGTEAILKSADAAGIAYLRNNALRWLDEIDALQGAGEREPLVYSLSRACAALWSQPDMDIVSSPTWTLWHAIDNYCDHLTAKPPTAPAPASDDREQGPAILHAGAAPLTEAELREWETGAQSSPVPFRAACEIRSLRQRLAAAETALAAMQIARARTGNETMLDVIHWRDKARAAEAQLARLQQAGVPADDGEALTDEWLLHCAVDDADFFEWQRVKVTFLVSGEGDRGAAKEVHVESRGDVRRICQCLGITLADTPAGGER